MFRHHGCIALLVINSKSIPQDQDWRGLDTYEEKLAQPQKHIQARMAEEPEEYKLDRLADTPFASARSCRSIVTNLPPCAEYTKSKEQIESRCVISHAELSTTVN